MLAALGSIITQQAKGTEKTYADNLWILNYALTHPNATIRYTANGMILHIHSNNSYLSKPRSRSHSGRQYFLGYTLPGMSEPPTTGPRLNDHIHSISRIMSNVMG